MLVCELLWESSRGNHMKTRFSLVVLLGACGGSGGSTDIESTLRFAERSDTEISRLVSAATGTEGFQAQAIIQQFDDPFEPDPTCPNIVLSGDKVTITGGCTTADGTTIEGSASVTNPLDWGDAYEYDFDDDTVYELDNFTLAESGFRQSFSGVFVLSGSFTERDMDITADFLGVAVRSDIFIECSRSSCSVSGSGVELVGVGGAKVSGSLKLSGQTVTGSFTLEGADTVKVTMENNCVSWKLEGTDRAFNPCTRQ